MRIRPESDAFTDTPFFPAEKRSPGTDRTRDRFANAGAASFPDSPRPSPGRHFGLFGGNGTGTARPVEGQNTIQSFLSGLPEGGLAVVLFTFPGNKRNAEYDPIFAKFARRDRGRHLFLRTENEADSDSYGVKTFPSVLVMDGRGGVYVVKDLLAVEREIGYFGLSPEQRLEDLARFLASEDANERGRSVLAYGRTATELPAGEALDAAAAALRGMFFDAEPRVAEAALFSYNIMRPDLSAGEAQAAARELPRLFTGPLEVALPSTDLFGRLAEKLERSDLEPGLEALKADFSHAVPYLACSALIAYGRCAPLLAADDVRRDAPVLRSRLAAENPDVRWAAVFAYGECASLFDDAEVRRAAETLTALAADPSAGIRWRSLNSLASLLPRLDGGELFNLAVRCRALIEDDAQQMDVVELAVSVYAAAAPGLPADELVLGEMALRKLAADEEYPRMREAGERGLAALKGS